MRYRITFIAVLTGLLVTGCAGWESDENGIYINPNRPNTPTERPIDKVLETSKPDPNNFGYNEYDEFFDGYSDPADDYEPAS